MHVLLVGGRGQLGQAIAHCYRPDPRVQVTIWDRPAVDIAQPAITDAVVELAPDAVINVAAWTDVDAAEAAPDETYAVNALGPTYLAEGCNRLGIFMLHVSTNEVFPGTPGTVYREYDQPGAGSIYARSKLAGERAVMAHHDRWMIARIAWLFSPGARSFPAKIMAAADRDGRLQVVADEIGNPTYAPDAAAAMVDLLATGRRGIYHLVNEGHASRYELAEHVLRLTGRGRIPLTPIAAEEWPRAAMPPRHAVLANQAAAALGIRLRPWQEAVADFAAAQVMYET